MGNTFSRCLGHMCRSSCSVERSESKVDFGSVIFIRTERISQSPCQKDTAKSEDSWASARGHDKQDIELQEVEDAWSAQVQTKSLPCELEDKKQDESKANDENKPGYSQTNDTSPCQTNARDAFTTNQINVANKHELNQADSPKLEVDPTLTGTTALSDDKQTRAILKTQERQSLQHGDYSHLSEVHQHLQQKIAASLQAEMEQVFPQENVTSLLPELQHAIEREIKLPFLQQIEYCALLDRQDAELKAMDRQLERKKLDHDIMFVLSQDCSKPPGIKNGQAERFGKRRRRRRKGIAQNSEAACGDGRCKRSKAAVRGRQQVTGMGVETAALGGLPDVSA